MGVGKYAACFRALAFAAAQSRLSLQGYTEMMDDCPITCAPSGNMLGDVVDLYTDLYKAHWLR